MKATLEFNLPDEDAEFRQAQDGGYWELVAWNMDEYLRGRIKYEELPEHVETALQLARDKLHELMDEHGLNFQD